MAFLNKLFMATAHVVTAPIAVVTDTIGVTKGCTKSTLRSAAKDAERCFDDLFDGDII